MPKVYGFGQSDAKRISNTVNVVEGTLIGNPSPRRRAGVRAVYPLIFKVVEIVDEETLTVQPRNLDGELSGEILTLYIWES